MAASDAFRPADEAPGRGEGTAVRADLPSRRHTLLRSSARSSWTLTLPFAAAYGLLALIVPMAPRAAGPATVTLTVLVVPLAILRWLRWLFRYGRSALVACPGHLELMCGSRWINIPWHALLAVRVVPGDRHAALVPPARPPEVVLDTTRGQVSVPLLLLRREDAARGMARLRAECAAHDIPEISGPRSASTRPGGSASIARGSSA